MGPSVLPYAKGKKIPPIFLPAQLPNTLQEENLPRRSRLEPGRENWETSWGLPCTVSLVGSEGHVGVRAGEPQGVAPSPWKGPVLGHDGFTWFHIAMARMLWLCS